MRLVHIVVKVRVTLQLTVSQSVSRSWLRAPTGTDDKIFVIGKTVLVLSVLGLPP